jgi:hypothetical protein
MVLFEQPTHFKHSISKPVCIFKEDKPDEDNMCDDDEEERIPEPIEKQYLPGERLLMRVNTDRKKEKRKKKRKKRRLILNLLTELQRVWHVLFLN